MTQETPEPVGEADGQARAAEPAAALFVGLVAIVLLSMIGMQTKFAPDAASPVLQPAFLPGLSLGLCALFGLWAWASSGGRRLSAMAGPAGAELLVLLRAGEFLAWFLAYVSIMPLAGYLASTLLFCCVLVWRLGYRTRRAVLFAALFAFMVVLFFKAFLRVKIPGGAVYEYLPAAARNFMIVNF